MPSPSTPAVVSHAATGSVFEPVLLLGSGGMGTATLCRAVSPGAFERLVVVKRPHPHILGQVDVLDRFMEEARVTASIHHANVIGTQQVGFDDQGPFIVLEYIEGTSLESLLEMRAGALPVPIALRLMLDALAGLQAVHTATTHDRQPLNLIHRDISLQNLLVGIDGVCRVADFGASKSDLRTFSTDQNYLIGKLLYLPPEYLRRDQVGPTLDIYSLGITLWFALTGRELWEGLTEAQVVACIMDGEIPRVSEVASVPPQIDALVARATHPDPQQRFQSAEAMTEAIEDLARRAGWLASHSEVAKLVKHLAQADLDERRQHIAGAFKAGAGGRLAAQQRERSAATVRRVSGAPNTSHKRTLLPWAILGSSLFSVGAVTGFFLLPSTSVAPMPTLDPAHTADTEHRQAQPAQELTPAGLAVREQPSVPEQAHEQDPVQALAPASDGAPLVAPSEDGPPAASNRRHTTRGTPAPASAPTSHVKLTPPKPAPAQPPLRSRGVSAPDRVTTTNPYR